MAGGDSGPLGLSLQQRFAPDSPCFGCGPANEQGLGLASFVVDPTGRGWAELAAHVGREVGPAGLPLASLIARFEPSPHHRAFDGILAGGVIATLLDCHANWTAAWALCGRDGLQRPPTTVTARLEVDLLAPCPLAPVELRSMCKAPRGRRVQVVAELCHAGSAVARLEGVFVAVRDGHPAFGAWQPG